MKERNIGTQTCVPTGAITLPCLGITRVVITLNTTGWYAAVTGCPPSLTLAYHLTRLLSTETMATTFNGTLFLKSTN